MNKFVYYVYCGKKPEPECFDFETDAMRFAREDTSMYDSVRVEKVEVDEEGSAVNSEVIWTASNEIVESSADPTDDNPFAIEFPKSDISEIEGSDDVDYDEIYKKYQEDQLEADDPYSADEFDGHEDLHIKEAVDALEENENEVECKVCFELFPKESCVKTDKGYVCQKCNQELHSHQGTNLDLIDADPFDLEYDDPRDPEDVAEPEELAEPLNSNDMRKHEAGIDEDISLNINKDEIVVNDGEEDVAVIPTPDADESVEEEELVEAKKDDELPVDPEAVKLEVHTMLNDLVADEIEAVNGYEEAKQEILDAPIEHKDALLDTVDHITAEEKEHIDELIDATKKIPFGKELAAPVVETPIIAEDVELDEAGLGFFNRGGKRLDSIFSEKGYAIIIKNNAGDKESKDFATFKEADEAAEISSKKSDVSEVIIVAKEADNGKNLFIRQYKNGKITLDDAKKIDKDFKLDKKLDDVEDSEKLKVSKEDKAEKEKKLVYMIYGTIGSKIYPFWKKAFSSELEACAAAKATSKNPEYAKLDIVASLIPEEIFKTKDTDKILRAEKIIKSFKQGKESLIGWNDVKAEEPAEVKEEPKSEEAPAASAPAEEKPTEETPKRDMSKQNQAKADYKKLTKALEILHVDPKVLRDENGKVTPEFKELRRVLFAESVDTNNTELVERAMVDVPFDSDVKVGDQIRISHLAGEDSEYDGKEGKVTSIDSIGQLHGTWGGLAVIPGVDDFEVITKECLKEGAPVKATE